MSSSMETFRSLPATRIGRRALLGSAAGVAAAGFLAGCGGSGSSTAGDVNEKTTLKLPTHVAPPEVEGGLVSKVAGMPPTYTSYPKTYSTTVPAPPGSGDEVTSFQILWGAPPNPLDKNVYWQQLNKNLNIKFKPTLVSSDNYNDKMATTVASGKVPDLMFVQDTTAVGAQAISDGVFADLSEVLAGDKVLEWKNLSNIGTATWKASAKNGHIYGIPNENPYLSNFPVIRADAMEAAGYHEVPKNADELKQMLTDMAKLGKVSGKKFWVVAGLSAGIQNMVQWMFRAGTGWQLDGEKLINVIETDAYQQSLQYLNELWKAGVFHPDALSLGTQAAKISSMFKGGQVGIHVDSTNGFFGAGLLRDLVKNTDGARPSFLVPPGHDGGKIVIARDAGYWGIVAISAEAAKDEKRLKELLGVCNYWRGPWGSKEQLFINSGVEGSNFKLKSDGDMVPMNNETADADRAGIQWLGCFNSPTVRIATSDKQFAQNYQTNVEKLTAATVPDPTVGLYSETSVSKSAHLAEITENYVNGIVSGRNPLSDLEKFRSEWKSAGGDKIRSEYTEAMNSSGSK